MTQHYRLNADGVWIDKATGKPMETRDGLFVPTVLSDTPGYKSPVTGKPVEGRAARRNDLARSGSREVDPSEWKPVYQTERYARANRGEHEPRQAVDLGEGYVRGPVVNNRTR